MEKHKEIIILGSGESILELSKEEVDYINNCEVVFALNKFMAFYEMTGIKPNYVYYVDIHSTGVRNFLKYIFEICRKDKLKGLTFVLSKEIENKVYKNPLNYFLHRLENFSIRRINKIKGKKETIDNGFLVPSDSKLYFIEHTSHLKGGDWAQNMKQTLYHFRGSLTTVLNVSTILFPGYTIKLVGTDFNNTQYFFQKEIDNLGIRWKDNSVKKTQEEKKHWSLIEIEGTTMLQKLPFIKESIQKSGSNLYVSNKKSFLVENDYLEYRPLIDN